MKKIEVSELKKMMDEKQTYVLLDVREKNEVDYASINPHTHIPLTDIVNRYAELNKEIPIIIMCRSGVRSAQACEFLQPLGFDVYNLTGGINMWSQVIDPSVPQY